MQFLSLFLVGTLAVNVNQILTLAKQHGAVDPRMVKLLSQEDVKMVMQTGDVRHLSAETIAQLPKEPRMILMKALACSDSTDPIGCAVDTSPLSWKEKSRLKECLAQGRASCVMEMFWAKLPAQVKSDPHMKTLHILMGDLAACKGDRVCVEGVVQQLDHDLMAWITELVKQHGIDLPAPSQVSMMVHSFVKDKKLVGKAMEVYQRIYDEVNADEGPTIVEV